ncbi:MAG: hypothetical protein U5K74_08455 [Gemmatimonadaceae bacterium]|nr:hypothetical protein [Gemmatimonadaceae bacterium]
MVDALSHAAPRHRANATIERAERPEAVERPEQPEAPQAVQPPAPPQAPAAPGAIIIGGETPAPGRITIERNGKTYTIDGATGGGDVSTSTGTPFPSDIPPGVQSLATTAIVSFALMVAAYPIFGFLKALVNRRASTQQLLPPRDTTDRLQRIEAAVEAMSVEVERISEGQRFVTKVLAERTTTPR